MFTVNLSNKHLLNKKHRAQRLSLESERRQFRQEALAQNAADKEWRRLDDIRTAKYETKANWAAWGFVGLAMIAFNFGCGGLGFFLMFLFVLIMP